MSNLPMLRSSIASSSRTTLIHRSTNIPKLVSTRLTSSTLPRHAISSTILRSTRTPFQPVIFRSFTSTTLKRNDPSTSTTTSSPNSQSQSNSHSLTSDSEESPEDSKFSITQRLKILFKKYGWYALGIYTILSTIDCSLSFLAVHTLGAERIKPIFDNVIQFYRLKRYGKEEAENLRLEDEEKRIKELKESESKSITTIKEEKNQWFSKTFWAELALAYAIHKTLLLPVRAGLTVAWTPKIVNWLASRGWVGKGGLTRAATHAQGKVKNASERVKDRVKKP
ncbi:uncharacterized protein I206_106766 [Kwoniella pini CBS 10737]|uniref:DUF1279 domain-containing protein n=1 Tax=Kwoniella pini CBS 10737 TaxID=1296096 RepID=A0A1B9HT94_9TREE|nr:uncharacterized protein I206_07346 [Kwoniella pini CBS 10737]OCF46493.1 hypothetical protein I206_07346 [Kwoniella pini CBS 10737]